MCSSEDNEALAAVSEESVVANNSNQSLHSELDEARPASATPQEQQPLPPPSMAVVEAPSPIQSDPEEAEDNAPDVQQAAGQLSDDEQFQQLSDQPSGEAEDAGKADADDDEDEEGNGAALLQQLSESLRQQPDSAVSDDFVSHDSAHRAAVHRQLGDHKRELDMLQSQIRRELAEEKRQLDQRLASRRQTAESATVEDRPSRLALDNPIHVALNLRPGSAARSYLPAELLPSGRVSSAGQQRVLPSTLTSEELRLLEDVRHRLARASVDNPELPMPQPRPRQPRRAAAAEDNQFEQRKQRSESAMAASAAARADEDAAEADTDWVDPLVRSTHERLAGVSDRIRRYQRESNDYFNQSVLLGFSPTEKDDANNTAAVANGGRFRGSNHSAEFQADSFRGPYDLGGFSRYNGQSAGFTSAMSPPSAGALVQQLSPADADTYEAEVAVGRLRRRNHVSASSGRGDRPEQQESSVTAAFEEERLRLLRELRDARAEASRAADLRRQLEEAHSALFEAAEGVASLKREHAAALARERAESERLRVRLAEARAETDRLKRRLAGAESEQMFLRNRERGVGSHSLSGSEWNEDQRLSMEPPRFTTDGHRSPTEALRQSLADLERRQLIDSLPQARDSMSNGGGSGGAPHWNRDAQLAEIRTLEQRYDQLQLEKRRVESALTHVPGAGSAKYGRQSREDKERLEKRLDSIDRELGSLRITLRQCHVIKSAS